jgi:hypothetical protein
VPIVMVDLRDAAAAEVRRVMRARAVRRDGDERALAELEGEGVWITRARRTTTRQALGTRAVLLWRVAEEDAGGRLVESTLVAVAVDIARRWPGGVVQRLELEVRPHVDAATRDWHQAAEHTSRDFASTRIVRERAIASAIDAGARAYQPGLFDRRAERERGDKAAAVAATQEATADRLASLERRVAIERRSLRLLLALVP